MAAALEDDIDFETLQAQLDKTWAYAHSVVDSWMKPGKAPASAPSTMSDKELNDLLRRPSRLGVGAPMPDTTSSSVTSTREALKLKYKLEGKEKKKRAREDDEKSKVGSQGEEEEEESRTSAIRKKPRLDPFASPGGKKRKAERAISTPNVVQQPVAGPSTSSATSLSPNPKKKGKRRELSVSQDESDSRHYSPAISATPSNAASSLKATSPESVATPLPISKHPHQTDKQGLSILNLDGPPPPSSSPSSTPSGTLSAAEKKRAKRRKQREKKKAQAKMQDKSEAASDPDEEDD